MFHSNCISQRKLKINIVPLSKTLFFAFPKCAHSNKSVHQHKQTMACINRINIGTIVIFGLDLHRNYIYKISIISYGLLDVIHWCLTDISYVKTKSCSLFRSLGAIYDSQMLLFVWRLWTPKHLLMFAGGGIGIYSYILSVYLLVKCRLGSAL